MHALKNCLLIVILFFISSHGFSQSQGPNSPSAAISVTATNGKPWSNPTNVFISDNVATAVILNPYPSCSGTTCFATTGLAATAFGFSIPGTMNIDGIVVEVEKRVQGAVANQVYDSTVMVMKNAVPTGVSKTSAIGWTGTFAYTSYGSPTDLWGTTWTPAEINDANFGLFFMARNTHTSISPQASVDHIRITVYYSIPTGITAGINDQGFSVYPNPGNSKFILNMSNSMYSITVRNILGEVIYSSTSLSQRTSAELDLSNHPKGIYFVQVLDENKKSSIKKIVLQ